MSISMDLRVLARKLEKGSDELFERASQRNPEVFDKVVTAVAAASTLLEGVADDMDKNASFEITPQQLDEIAAVASAFDESNDPLLRKQASVLDEILLTIGSSKDALAQVKKAKEDEIKRLREERRRSQLEDAYQGPRKVLSDINGAKEQAKAVEQQVKRFLPLEAPLQTRYPPDRPGGQMTRITDHVYQDVTTGIIYDFKQGYTTQKGNKVPGTSVENQTRDYRDSFNQGPSLFKTRDSLMNRYAGDLSHLNRYTKGNEVSNALKYIRDFAPNILSTAIDYAINDGFTPDDVSDFLTSDVVKKAVGQESSVWLPSVTLEENHLEDESGPQEKSVQKLEPLNEEEGERVYLDTLRLINNILPTGWFSLIRSQIDAVLGLGLPDYLKSRLIKLLSASDSDFTEVLEDLSKEVDLNGFKENIEDEGPVSSDLPTVPASRSSNNNNNLNKVAIALNAVQELAPHLLSSAVQLAKKDGLSDKYINGILASKKEQISKFAFGECGEIKIAESLFPQFKDLKWNSLIVKQLQEMNNLGVKKESINKLQREFLKKKDDINSIDKLKIALKLAIAAEEAAEQIPEAPEGEGLINPITHLDDWVDAHKAIVNSVFGGPQHTRWAELEMTGNAERAYDDYQRFMGLKMNNSGYVSPYDEYEPGFTWFNYAESKRPDLEELVSPPGVQTGLSKVVEFKKPEESKLLTPVKNLERWLERYDAARTAFERGAFKHLKSNIEGEFTMGKISPEEMMQKKKEALNAIMRSSEFNSVGPFEDSGDGRTWYEVAGLKEEDERKAKPDKTTPEEIRTDEPPPTWSAYEAKNGVKVPTEIRREVAAKAKKIELDVKKEAGFIRPRWGKERVKEEIVEKHYKFLQKVEANKVLKSHKLPPMFPGLDENIGEIRMRFVQDLTGIGVGDKGEDARLSGSLDQEGLIVPGEDEDGQWFNLFSEARRQQEENINKFLASHGKKLPGMSRAAEDRLKEQLGLSVDTLPKDKKAKLEKVLGKGVEALTPSEKEEVENALIQKIPPDKIKDYISIGHLEEIPKDKKDLFEKEKKKRINTQMREAGLATPYNDRIFGSVTLASILAEAKVFGDENPFADYGGKATLFSDPKGYAGLFRTLWDMFPKESKDMAKIDEMMERSGFYPPSKPAVGDMSFKDIYFFEAKNRRAQKRYIEEQKKKEEEASSGGRRGFKGSPAESGGEQEAATQSPTKIEPMTQEKPEGITPVEELDKWVEAFKAARTNFKKEFPEEYKLLSNKETRENVKWDYMQYVNRYMKSNGFAPAFSSKGNPNGMDWWKEAVAGGAKLV